MFAEDANAQPAATDPTLVTIDSGAIRGVAADPVISFEGIPVTPWQGVRETKQFAPSCMQTDDIAKSEDCLTLNIWRPAAAQAGLLPVMVWIYGGALVHGSTSIYPGGDQSLDELAQQVFADRTLVEPSRHLADAMVRAGQPTWWYRFSYVGESARATVKGALHAMEIPYTFDKARLDLWQKVWSQAH